VVVSKKPEVRCPSCKNKVLTKPNQTSATCRCGTRFNTTTDGVISPAPSANNPPKEDSHSLNSSQHHQVRCPSCENKVLTKPNQTSATCRCGTRFNTTTGRMISPAPGGAVPRPPPQPSPPPPPPRSNPLARPSADSPQVFGKLGTMYPNIAEQLKNLANNGHVLSGTLEESANRIYYLGQLWLVFLDGDDFGLTRDREIYNHIREVAQMRPRRSIEDEAEWHMNIWAVSMTTLEIKLALKCGVESVGFILEANGNFDYTLSSLIETRNQSNWSMIGK